MQYFETYISQALFPHSLTFFFPLHERYAVILFYEYLILVFVLLLFYVTKAMPVKENAFFLCKISSLPVTVRNRSCSWHFFSWNLYTRAGFSTKVIRGKALEILHIFFFQILIFLYFAYSFQKRSWLSDETLE